MKNLAAAACTAVVLATTTLCTAATPDPSIVSPTTRDGHNDFNFLFGNSTTHYRILRRRLRRSQRGYGAGDGTGSLSCAVGWRVSCPRRASNVRMKRRRISIPTAGGLPDGPHTSAMRYGPICTLEKTPE